MKMDEITLGERVQTEKRRSKAELFREVLKTGELAPEPGGKNVCTLLRDRTNRAVPTGFGKLRGH